MLFFLDSESEINKIISFGIKKFYLLGVYKDNFLGKTHYVFISQYEEDVANMLESLSATKDITFKSHDNVYKISDSLNASNIYSIVLVDNIDLYRQIVKLSGSKVAFETIEHKLKFYKKIELLDKETNKENDPMVTKNIVESALSSIDINRTLDLV